MVSILEVFLLNEVHLFHILTVVWWSILVVTLTCLRRRNPSSSIVSIRMVCEHIYRDIFSLTNWSRKVQHTCRHYHSRPGLSQKNSWTWAWEQTRKHLSSMVFASVLVSRLLLSWVPVLVSVMTDYIRCEMKQTLSFPSLFLTILFTMATETKLEQVVTVFSCDCFSF